MADGDPARIGHEAMVVMHLPPSAESPTNTDVSGTTLCHGSSRCQGVNKVSRGRHRGHSFVEVQRVSVHSVKHFGSFIRVGSQGNYRARGRLWG